MIHHATAKKATDNQVKLVESTDDKTGLTLFTATAHYKKEKVEIVHPKAPVALEAVLLRRMLKGEYRAISTFTYDLKDEQFEAYIGAELVFEAKELPSLSDLLDSIYDVGFDPQTGKAVNPAEGRTILAKVKRVRSTEEDGDDEENETEGEEPSGEDEESDKGSVVPAKFKKIYKAAGHPDDCGDWLASQLKQYCHIKPEKGKAGFNLDLYTEILCANKVGIAGTWATNRNRGWQGRYRMASRNILVKKVADCQLFVVPDVASGEGRLEIRPPKEWCEENKSVVKEIKPRKKAA